MGHLNKLKQSLRLDAIHQIVCDETYIPVHSLTVNGKKITYATLGEGEPLVLVHGWSGAWYGWIRTAKYLQKHFKVYMIDLPGFGTSDTLDHYTIKNEAEYLVAIIKKLGIKPKGIVGLSMSSFIVAQAVATNPKLTSKLLLFGAILKTRRLNRISHVIMHTFFTAVNKHNSTRYVIKKTFERRLVAHVIARSLGMYEYRRELVDTYSILSRAKMNEHSFVDMYVSSLETNLEDVLEKIKHPILLVFGLHDKLTNEEQAREKLKGIKSDITFGSATQCGHVVPTEQPKQTADWILKFMDREEI